MKTKINSKNRKPKYKDEGVGRAVTPNLKQHIQKRSNEEILSELPYIICKLEK